MEREGTSILDMDIDSLANSASHLDARDLASMAITCRRLRDSVYSDAVWEAQCRKQWPAKQMPWGTFQYCGGRKAYLDRFVASRQFRYMDPIDWQFSHTPTSVGHILFEQDSIAAAQDQIILKFRIDSSDIPIFCQFLSGHNARITCMRSYPNAGVAFSRNIAGHGESLLVTSSSDHTIRLWRKNSSFRTLRGHSGPVTALSDCLMGSFILASGSMDATIRLWSLRRDSTRGRSCLQATFYGHEHTIKDVAVARHNPSILVSAAKDCKILVWDINSPSATGTGGCVGSLRIPVVPVGVKCKGNICYIAGGSSIVVIDIRSMQIVASVAGHETGILTFDITESGSILCTGGNDKTAKLWDLRDFNEAYAVLGDHEGPVSCMHIDSYKVVTGGTKDNCVHVWDAKTGDEITVLESLESTDVSQVGISAMAVNGPRIVTGTTGDAPGIIRFRDFSNCAVSAVSSGSVAECSKFWDTDFNERLKLREHC